VGEAHAAVELPDRLEDRASRCHRRGPYCRCCPIEYRAADVVVEAPRGDVVGEDWTADVLGEIRYRGCWRRACLPTDRPTCSRHLIRRQLPPIGPMPPASNGCVRDASNGFADTRCVPQAQRVDVASVGDIDLTCCSGPRRASQQTSRPDTRWARRALTVCYCDAFRGPPCPIARAGQT
jgi:hypothetical protein